MMDCQQIAPLLAALADEHGMPPEPPVARHLESCDRCQRLLALQREMHDLIRSRAAALQGCAPDAFRAQVAAQLAGEPPYARRWSPLHMPVAATMLLTAMGVFIYGVTSASSRLLAAQLALDHLKCVQLVGNGTVINPTKAARDWAQQYHWTPRVPPASQVRGASLVGVRRCLYGHGHLAHLLYEVDGHVVSLFVMPRSERPPGGAPATVDVLGHRATVWASTGQTFAVIGDVSADVLATLANEFRASR